MQRARLEPSICHCDGRGHEGFQRKTTVGAVVGRRALPYDNDQGGTKKEVCVMSRKLMVKVLKMTAGKEGLA